MKWFTATLALLALSSLNAVTGDNGAFYPSNCVEILRTSDVSGVYTVYLHVAGNAVPFEVYCDRETDGGGLMVFQRNTSRSRDTFNQVWADNRKGFGELAGEF